MVIAGLSLVSVFRNGRCWCMSVGETAKPPPDRPSGSPSRERGRGRIRIRPSRAPAFRRYSRWRRRRRPAAPASTGPSPPVSAPARRVPGRSSASMAQEISARAASRIPGRPRVALRPPRRPPAAPGRHSASTAPRASQAWISAGLASRPVRPGTGPKGRDSRPCAAVEMTQIPRRSRAARSKAPCPHRRPEIPAAANSPHPASGWQPVQTAKPVPTAANRARPTGPSAPISEAVAVPGGVPISTITGTPKRIVETRWNHAGCCGFFRTRRLRLAGKRGGEPRTAPPVRACRRRAIHCLEWCWPGLLHAQVRPGRAGRRLPAHAGRRHPVTRTRVRCSPPSIANQPVRMPASAARRHRVGVRFLRGHQRASYRVIASATIPKRLERRKRD